MRFVTSSFFLLVVMPGATSSFLLLVAMPCAKKTMPRVIETFGPQFSFHKELWVEDLAKII